MILAVMISRVMQPKADGEEEEQSLYVAMTEEQAPSTSARSPAFPDEQHFPVLLFSFVGPQHARILCASMYQKQLRIRMSKLYSFERKDEAPLDLFTSWLFSDPVIAT